MSNLNINKAYKFCKLLKIECIKQEIEEITKDYTLDKMELKNGEWICSFHKDNGEAIILCISFNNIHLMKYRSNFIERVEIDEKLLLTDRSIDKRENGVVYSVIQKQFMPSVRFKNEIALTDLTEQRYTFTKNNFENLIDNFDFNNIRMSLFLLKILKLERNGYLKEKCDFYSEFVTHMNFYYSSILDNPRKTKDNIYPSKTYLNDKDVSSLYEVDGHDKIYRIYDLYRGIINPRNEKDINSINLGLMDPTAYDLMTFDGIRDKEDCLIGIQTKINCEEYLEYLKLLFFRDFGYKGELKLNRDSILSAMKCEITGYRRVKKMVERKLDIPYDEFEKLDYDEQQKLIEEKLGNKVNIDYRLRIDGIPIDEDHIVTREQMDKRIDEICMDSKKSILSRLLSPFKRKRF